MKRYLLMCVLIVFYSINCFSQANYNGRNGEIIYSSNNFDSTIFFRKHIQKLQIGFLADKRSLILYSNFDGNSEIGKLKLDDSITITKAGTKYSKNGKLLSSRLFIQKDNSSGWIDIQDTDPYNNSRWSIVSNLYSSGKNWTIRKIDQEIQIEKEIIVYDKPSITSNVINSIANPNKDKFIYIRAISATEEFDTIKGNKDRWVQVTLDQNKNGWIFGGFCPVYRNGPLIWTPEEIVYFCLGTI